MNRYAIYTGPTQVGHTAERLRAQGITVTVEGTMRVHVETDKTEAELLDVLGPTWRLGDIMSLGPIK